MLGYYEKKRAKMYLRRGLVLGFVYAILFLSLFFSTPIERFLNGDLFFYNKNYTEAQCRIHFLDVGQGDSTFIELNNGGTTIMIDAGPKKAQGEVKKYMAMIGRHRIDYLILTHTDSDHVGGAVDLINNFDVRSVFVPMIYSTYDVENGLDTEDFYIDSSPLWAEVRSAIFENIGEDNIYYSFAGKSILGTDFSLEFLSPWDKKPCGEEVASTNNYSPILMLSCFDTKAMFVGDIDSECESSFLSHYKDLADDGAFDVDVLKVAHHGSKSSSSKDFLKAVSPEYAVVSCGESNSYNHAHDDTINRLVDAKSNILRTDINGSVILACGGKNIVAFFDFCHIGEGYFSILGIILSFVIVSALLFVFSIKISSEPKM